MSVICRARRSARRPRRRIASRCCARTPIRGPRSSFRRAWRSRSARSSRSWPVRAISRSRRTGLYLWSRHLAEPSARESDFVAVAERFLETPYLWGGRTSEGIDCSGLVQTALTAAGVAAPRDSDMQEKALGEPLAVDDPELPACARRSRVLERARRDHARSSDPASRQRLAYEDGERAASASPRANCRQWRRRGHERS